MRVCQCHQLATPREEGTGSYIRVCPSPSVTAPVYLPLLLAVIASGIGHFHTARASSRLTSHGCTSCKKTRKHHGPIACFTPRRALIGTRFPTQFFYFLFFKNSFSLFFFKKKTFTLSLFFTVREQKRGQKHDMQDVLERQAKTRARLEPRRGQKRESTQLFQELEKECTSTIQGSSNSSADVPVDSSVAASVSVEDMAQTDVLSSTSVETQPASTGAMGTLCVNEARLKTLRH